MLDITLLRKDLPFVIAQLEKRKSPQEFLDVAAFQAMETERKTLQMRVEELQSQRNSASKRIGQMKAQAQDTSAVMHEVAGIADELKASGDRLLALQAELNTVLMALPNLPHISVPVGSDESGNVEVRRWVWTSTPASSCQARASVFCAAAWHDCTAPWRSSC